ncbi:MAG: Holliday junction resolvase RuvX [Actinomycetota bacterium]
MQIGRRFAFDVGKARIGVAASDPHAILCSPQAHIKRSDDINISCAEALALLVSEQAICAYVGLPINLHSKNTESTLDAILFASQLQDLTDIPVRLIDERLSTKSAAASLREVGHSAKQQKGLIDSAAAAVILEQALILEKSADGFAGKTVSEVSDAI